MSTHYDALKQQLGLDEALAPSSEDEKDDYICKSTANCDSWLDWFPHLLEMITEQKKEFRRKMRKKRMELKAMLIKRAMNPVDKIYDKPHLPSEAQSPHMIG